MRIYRSAVLNRRHFASTAEYRRQFIESYCEFKRWLAAMHDSVRWLYDPANRDEAIAILAEWTKTSEDDSRGTYSIVVEQDKAYPPELRGTRAHLEALVDLMREVGTAPDPLPDLDRFLDNSYLDEALRLPAASR